MEKKITQKHLYLVDLIQLLASLKFRVLAPGNAMTVLISPSLWNIPTGALPAVVRTDLAGPKFGRVPPV